ncbi:MAG: murein biosynthesis integral membrane protein MurJ [Patescibacteria group bacterium]|nr:MAG: murein biosynthesis integral membrane protein MurJ [Patescibacteria group bacterium]
MFKLFTQESKTIAGGAFLIAVSSILSRILGLFRDRLLVSRFGVSDALDAYYASFQIPNFLFALLILGTLSVAFIPVFTEYVAKDKREDAWRMTNSILTIVGVVMGVLCLALSIGAHKLVPVIAPGFEGEKLQLTIALTRVMMLSPFVFALSAVLTSVLNARKRFLAASLAPLLYNASIIFGIVALSKPFGVLGVAYGAILGAVLHFLVQLPAVIALGWRARFVFDTKHEGVREVGRLFLPRVFGIDISQISQFVGTAIGTTFGVGAPALFNLAMNIAAVPVGVVAIPFAMAAFPTLSEAAARNDREAFRSTFSMTLRQILFFLVPLTTLAFVLRLQIIRVLIGAQTLSWNDTRLSAAALALAILTMSLQGLAPLLARAFYALKNTWIPVAISLAAMTANIIATFALKGWLSGTDGRATAWLWLYLFGIDDVRVLALTAAFSIASIVQVTLLFYFLRRTFGRLGASGIFRALGKYVLGAFAAAWAAGWVLRPGMQSVDTRSLGSVFTEATVASLAGFAVYVAVLRLLKSEELGTVIGMVRRRFFRRGD